MKAYLLISLFVSSGIGKLPIPPLARNKGIPLIGTKSLDVALTRKNIDVCLGNEAPFCDSTWLSYPNLNAAMFGVDLPSLNPVPNDFISEPGMRNQIFQATYRLETGIMSQYDFVQTIDDLRCTTKFDEHLYESFESLIDGWSEMEQTGFGTNFDLKADLNFNYKGVGGSISIPPLFSRSQSKRHEAEGMAKLFNNEKGSVAHSRAECSIYRVVIDINNPTLAFYSGFANALLEIDDTARRGSPQDKTQAGIRFIERFGTHYAKSTQMGSAIAFETRYTGSETRNVDEGKRKDCSTLSGSRVFGFQVEQDKSGCNGTLGDTATEKDIKWKREIMKTIGSFPAGAISITDWSKQLQDMAKAGKSMIIFVIFQRPNNHHKNLLISTLYHLTLCL